MIKVAYILTPIEFGGSERINLLFLERVNRAKFSIHPILLVRPWESQSVFHSRLQEFGYQAVTIPVAKKPSDQGRDFLRVGRCMYRLFQALSRQRFDLVHSHGYFADTIAAPATRLLGIPHVATCHGYINTSIALKIYNRLDLAALANCQKIIAVSNGIQQYLVQRGLNPFKIDVIPNAVPTFSTQWLNAQRTKARSALAIHDQQFVMGYVGRLSIEKGIHHLIEALSIVRSQSNNSFHLFIIGDGPERSRLQEMSKKYSLNQHITFTGFQQEVSRYLNALDILVLPSLTEGTPMALLEAMSLGVPTVATRVGGVPDIVSDGVDGFLVRPGNAGHLAERILSLLESPESLKHASSSAKMKIQQHYDVEHWCRRIEHLYSRTCHPQSLRPCVHPGCNPTDS